MSVSASAAAGTRVNGIHKMSMTEMGPTGFSILEPNTEKFTLLAAAINTGIRIIESDAGRQAFAATGRDVVARWTAPGSSNVTTFWGDTNRMEFYVDVFLQKIREDFPRVVVLSFGSPDKIAEYRRIDGPSADFGGDINHYHPKNAGGIYFNASRVSDMVRAAAGKDKKHRERYLNFHFLFAAATAHEMMHGFTTLLARASSTPEKFTPPGTTHLDYGDSPATGEGVPMNQVGAGESGRFMERFLFGGSLEFYRDTNDDDGQCGVVHRLDDHAVAKRLDAASCWKIVRHEDFTFPIPTVGSNITQQQRRQLNLRSLGSIRPHSTAMSGPSSRDMKGKTEKWYSVSAAELQEVVTKDRRALTIRAVNVRA